MYVQDTDRLDSAGSPLSGAQRRRGRRAVVLVMAVVVTTYGLLHMTDRWWGPDLGVLSVHWGNWALSQLRVGLGRIEQSLNLRSNGYLGMALLNIAACWLAALLLRRR